MLGNGHLKRVVTLVLDRRGAKNQADFVVQYRVSSQEGAAARQDRRTIKVHRLSRGATALPNQTPLIFGQCANQVRSMLTNIADGKQHLAWELMLNAEVPLLYHVRPNIRLPDTQVGTLEGIGGSRDHR